MPAHDYRLNQTALDAFYRVADAKTGSLAGDPAVGPATDEYLLALQRELARWQEQVAQELAQRVARANGRALDECDYLYEGPGGIQDREDFHSDG
jgi:hypothetical protein